MKRFLIVFMILGLIGGSVVTAEANHAARKRVERTVEGTYATTFVPPYIVCSRHGGLGCVTIETREHDAFLTGKVVDAHGQPVFVQVWAADTDPEGHSIEYGSFCGETREPIAFDRGDDIILVVGYFWIHDLVPYLAKCRPMFGTTGRVSVTLSNLP